MSGDPLALLRRYRTAGVLIDTNILLLLFVGTFDRSRIARFKRTVKFAEEDYDLVVQLLALFQKKVTTPNILTEVSNLAGQLEGHVKPGFFQTFAEGISLLVEDYVPSMTVAAMPAFRRFGLTDAGMLHTAQNRYLVLTDDFALWGYLASEGVSALNFDEIRTLNWT